MESASLPPGHCRDALEQDTNPQTVSRVDLFDELLSSLSKLTEIWHFYSCVYWIKKPLSSRFASLARCCINSTFRAINLTFVCWWFDSKWNMFCKLICVIRFPKFNWTAGTRAKEQKHQQTERPRVALLTIAAVTLAVFVLCSNNVMRSYCPRVCAPTLECYSQWRLLTWEEEEKEGEEKEEEEKEEEKM